jgi:hypothetical protein
VEAIHYCFPARWFASFSLAMSMEAEHCRSENISETSPLRLHSI